ncbi:MAG: MarC family protein [Phreatobacter sp.]|uniref:MarC family protein n=1 Tax=Phreatobacter sp. TaxID=1966341 RepID=UPI001A4D7DB0|nr:MarC family protein [Phreatobacter sp.]MBL8571652.1 MarC family protein [Phreatobacter sp.]MCA0319098.1 MarC family protein [Pseudomonadota bacterium]
MTLEFLTGALVTMLVIVEPIALVPIFLAVTQGFSADQRRQVAWRACVIAFAILASCAFVGDWLLSKVGISLPAFRIAGGLLVFWIAFEMVFGLRANRKNEVARDAIDKEHIVNVAAFPMAIPLLAGPGAITATLLLAGQAEGRPALMATLVAVLAVVILISWICLQAAERVDRMLGTLGNVVVSRLLGIILAALAVQFVIDGIRAAIRAA